MTADRVNADQLTDTSEARQKVWHDTRELHAAGRPTRGERDAAGRAR